MNMIESSEVVKIFLDYEISNIKDEREYTISTLDGITNNTVVVSVDNKKFVLRIPGKNPDVINRKSEKLNSIKAYEAGLTLPFILFDEITGIKISEFFDLYTYEQQDFNDKEMKIKDMKDYIRYGDSDSSWKESTGFSRIIQAIIDSRPRNWTKKDFLGEGKLNQKKLMTRNETDRKTLKFYKTGRTYVRNLKDHFNHSTEESVEEYRKGEIDFETLKNRSSTIKWRNKMSNFIIN